MAVAGRNVSAPLLFLNLVMYFIVLGFASWSVDRCGWKWSNEFLLDIFNRGCRSGNSVQVCRSAACQVSTYCFGLDCTAFGFACKHVNIGGWRGWRLRIQEAFIIILAFTQLLYLLLIHAGVYRSRYGPGYRDTNNGMRGPGDEQGTKAATGVTGSRV
ncbi:putative Caldesmon [Hibiscus syriacus]|uniref:Caldesmon n=1 Tax=Hibiscus syriacus TaxID=106335 RepID=A0A6A2ZXP2_HIBSY|nr:putative Caldesmon [Hibiscus syriacus]